MYVHIVIDVQWMFSGTRSMNINWYLQAISFAIYCKKKVIMATVMRFEC